MSQRAIFHQSQSAERFLDSFEEEKKESTNKHTLITLSHLTHIRNNHGSSLHKHIDININKTLLFPSRHPNISLSVLHTHEKVTVICSGQVARWESCVVGGGLWVWNLFLLQPRCENCVCKSIAYQSHVQMSKMPLYSAQRIYRLLFWLNDFVSYKFKK